MAKKAIDTKVYVDNLNEAVEKLAKRFGLSEYMLMAKHEDDMHLHGEASEEFVNKCYAMYLKNCT